MSAITNGNDYQRGFKDGQKDAEASKDPNYSRMGLSWKYVLHGTIALDSYTRGYQDGYRETMRKNVVQRVEIVAPPTALDTPSIGTTGSTGITSSRTKSNNGTTINHKTSFGNMGQSIQLQIEALEQLQQFLLETIAEIDELRQRYTERVNVLREEGLSVEIADYYNDEYCTPNSTVLSRLTERIQEEDLPYIREEIQRFEDLLG